MVSTTPFSLSIAVNGYFFGMVNNHDILFVSLLVFVSVYSLILVTYLTPALFLACNTPIRLNFVKQYFHILSSIKPTSNFLRAYYFLSYLLLYLCKSISTLSFWLFLLPFTTETPLHGSYKRRLIKTEFL